ncbi:CDP-glycerol glycerophosphotransferase family protein [Glutamicibacter sp.]|uniref:CDP-glycerol glycerophosphotransferase family protein n=1 Tax=Glutamicibacter sp. TaxID=1931995 RepID=UPI0028BE8919|nr:CDP-glycerol glycerophosphotransferase family protein [Glutamicibacter sp.]
MSASFKAGIRLSLNALGRQPLVRRASQLMGFNSNPAGVSVGISNISIPGTVAVYFGDGADKIYQLTQWLPVLEDLHEKHEVLLVFRSVGAYKAAGKISALPRAFVRRFGDLMDLYDDNDLKLVIYVNNSRSNFQSLDHPRLVHVHVNHGESDKLSMVSNKAKAYDKVFVAGPAAIKRHEAMLIDFDLDKLVVVGRPQLDINFAPELEPSRKFDVLYAPTWEGENEDNNYTSIDLYGTAIVASLLSNPAFRVIYKPHPRVEESKTPGVAEGHAKIMELIAEANAAGGEHIVSERGNILAMFEATDALITDVSSVGLDYLYLQPEKPLIISDRRSNRERLLRDAPIAQACPVIDQDSIGGVDELLETGLLKDENAQLRREMRNFYFGDLELGQSTERFQEVVADLIETREGQLAEFKGWHS